MLPSTAIHKGEVVNPRLPNQAQKLGLTVEGCTRDREGFGIQRSWTRSERETHHAGEVEIASDVGGQRRRRKRLN